MNILMKTLVVLIVVMGGCLGNAQKPVQDEGKRAVADYPDTVEEIVKTDKAWKKELDEMEYYVLREKGTERPFTGLHWNNKKSGVYTCAACGLALFDSDTKYRSGTGWPSFYEPISKKYIKEDYDYDIGYKRTEVLCARCGGHLGHVFEDGPKPTGLRYCINSVSLDFVPQDETEDQ